MSGYKYLYFFNIQTGFLYATSKFLIDWKFNISGFEQNNSVAQNLLINLSYLLQKPTGTTIYALNLLPYLQNLNPILLANQNFPEYNCYPVTPNKTPEQGIKGHLNRLVWTQYQLPHIYTKLKSSLLFSPIPEIPIYTNCRAIVMVHDLIPLRFPKRFSPLTPYFRYYVPQVLKQAQHIICNSQATANDIIDFYKIPIQKITPISLAYDAKHFCPLDRENSQEQVPYFLYVGRQEPYKNLYRLIAAFSQLPNHQDYQLWLVGPTDPRYTPRLKLQIQELQLNNQIKFLDYVPYKDLPQIINQALALVYPSLWEGFGFPVLEAMACGTPVITSNLSSLPEVAGDAAILINPHSISEITEAMGLISTDNKLRDRLSDAGISRASQFSWEKTGKATRDILLSYL